MPLLETMPPLLHTLYTHDPDFLAQMAPSFLPGIGGILPRSTLLKEDRKTNTKRWLKSAAFVSFCLK